MPGEWHNKMEKYFPKEMREVKFYCSSRIDNTCRRADICLSNERTCEIQHSYISEYEIINRFNDWNKFGKDIIWLIDGNEGIELDKLSNGNYILIFKQLWKYKSFIKTYDYILLEKDNLVFKIELNKIKSSMIELREPKTLEETIDYLKTKPSKIWDFWSADNSVKSILGVYQQGAGNGKTYGIWKSITENTDRKTYIIVTKQHSAKNVIYEELIDQTLVYHNTEGKEAYHIENIVESNEFNTEKHFVIKYTHKRSKKQCTVIIGTIDSFCYNLSHSNSKGVDFFKGIVDNIKKNGPTKINNGYMNFGSQSIQLSKECEIWIDEVQDLPENYLHAMIKLIYETGCYMNVVGDKLQSLEFKNNFLTTISNEGLPNIEIVQKEHINKNRRIKVTNMGDKINELVNFTKYGLPIIECDEAIQKDKNEEPIKIIDSPIIYPNDIDNKKIECFLNEIIEKYKYEAETNNYLPNDFLIIFPIMKDNLIASELETKIQEYWTDKYKNHEKYIRYVFLHKHTQGTVINTKDSVDATRIMSIRSSKGDGRKVVFILGITENSLKLVSNKEKGIVYESYIHVALTRAKNQIYFALEKNNDDIHKIFGKTGYCEYLPNITRNINLDKINNLINKEKMIQLLETNLNIISEEHKIEESDTVDWGYHCIKYQTFYFQTILNIIRDENISKKHNKTHLFVVLRIISDYKIYSLEVKEFYEFLNNYQYNDDFEMPYFPLCKISNKPEYMKYCNIIKEAIIEVQKNIKNNTLSKLTIYQSIVLTYMIQICTSKKYADMTPMDIYNITDYFQQNTNKEKELLNNLKNIKSIIEKSSIKSYQNIEWNIFKHIELDSKKDYFKISKLQYPIIGNNETDIIHIILKSNISQLNYWDIMTEVLLERFLIYNPKSEKDIKKYKDKKINTYIFLLDTNSFIKIDWEWDKALINEIKSELKEVLKEYFEYNHTDLYKYFDYIKNNNNDIWNQDPVSIVEIIIQKYEDMYSCPEYIIDFFKSICEKIEDGEDYSFIDNIDTFNERLNKKLVNHINKYLK